MSHGVELKVEKYIIKNKFLMHNESWSRTESKKIYK
jgi:hypothetical protein